MGYFEYIKMWRTITVFWCFITVFANEQNWWKNAQIYEVFVPSFKDSNGDGIGDIKGNFFFLNSRLFVKSQN